jgi:RNA polymerase sigma-B factor
MSTDTTAVSVFEARPLPGCAEGIVLALSADLDFDTAQAARQQALAALEPAPAAVVVDLTGAFAGATVIPLLLEMSEIITAAGVPMAVTGAPSWLSRVAPRVGLPRMSFAPDPEVALAHLTSGREATTAPAPEPAEPDLAADEQLDEVAELYAARRILVSGPQARRFREEAINGMLPFAKRLARRYRAGREGSDDLEQVARMGLVKAVDRYELGRGSFTAYALATISGELKRHFRDHTWGVHVPRRLQNLALAITRAESTLAVELGRRPTDAEVADRCGVAVDELDAARQSGAGYRPASLSHPLGETGGELQDLYGEIDHAIEGVADQVTLRRLIEHLPARERRILLERYYGNRTQSEIAADLGVSQMHVSRLLSRTLAWLRTGMLTDETPAWPADDPAASRTGPVVAIDNLPYGVVRVIVAGEVDRDNAGRMRRALQRVVDRASTAGRVEVDLASVPLVDAAGVAALVAVHEAAEARGVVLTLAGAQPFVGRILAVTGLGPLLSPRP